LKANDPYKIAKDNGVLVVAEPLATVYGYYSRVEGQRIIHINDQLSEYLQRYVAANMLYGALFRPDDMLFMKEKRADRFTEVEKAANAYAVDLLLGVEDPDVAGTIEAQMDRYGMTEKDRDDLTHRLAWVWDFQDGTTLTDQIRHVIAVYRKGGADWYD